MMGWLVTYVVQLAHNLRGCLCLQHGRVLQRLCEQHLLLVTNFLATCCMPARGQASASTIKVQPPQCHASSNKPQVPGYTRVSVTSSSMLHTHRRRAHFTTLPLCQQLAA